MLTAPVPTLQHLLWDSASRRGSRSLNADAFAIHRDPVTGRTAFVVADGIGDSLGAARAAWLAANTAAEAAASGQDPADAILTAQRAVRAALPGEESGDTVLAVAVPDAGPAGLALDVAWVGDCRVYHSNGRVLEQVTTDHTVAEYFRSRGRRATQRMEHMVTTSVRTVRPERIGRNRTGFAAGRLLLCSDGVHKPLPVGALREILDRPAAPDLAAKFLADNALALGGTDNTTALVVDHFMPSPRAMAA